VNEVSKFIGIPYESHGRSYEGSDCWGIIYLFYRDIFGIEIPKYDVGYKDAYDANSVGEIINSHLNEWKEVKSGLFGDGILFKIAGKTVHAGVYLNESEFLHSLSGQDSCICRLDSITWSRRIAGIYRWPRNIQG
jgi:cell wall-associated NlpC family hydrolase